MGVTFSFAKFPLQRTANPFLQKLGNVNVTVSGAVSLHEEKAHAHKCAKTQYPKPLGTIRRVDDSSFLFGRSDEDGSKFYGAE